MLKFDVILLVLIIGNTLLISTIKCDLYLFSRKNDLADNLKPQQQQQQDHQSGSNVPSINDPYDKLHLFPYSKLCTDQFDSNSQEQKEKFCKQYCFNESKNDKAILFGSNDDMYVRDELGTNEKHISLNGILHYYRSFVFALLTHIDRQLTNHEIQKLKKMSESQSQTESVEMVQDVTDILKNMIVEVKEHKVFKIWESFREFMRICFNDYNMHYFITISVIGVSIVVMPKLGFQIPWKRIILCSFLLFFVVSVINNHSYLSQKKQIYKQQKLKEEIPEECQPNNDLNNKEKGSFKKIIGIFKYHLGYTATSRRCLEYHEALYLSSVQHNFVETIIYTITESIRPLSVAFGQSVNEFYSALTNGLSFYQYIPLLIGVTIVLVTLIIFVSSFLSLMVFGYELNFFHLIKFKKTYAPNNAIKNEEENKELSKMLADQKAEMLKILCELKKENFKKKSIEANQITKSLQSNTSSIDSSSMIEHKSERIYTIESLDVSQQLNQIESNRNNANNNQDDKQLTQSTNDDMLNENDENLNDSLRENFKLYKEKNEMKEKYYSNAINQLADENSKLKNLIKTIGKCEVKSNNRHQISNEDIINQQMNPITDSIEVKSVITTRQPLSPIQLSQKQQQCGSKQVTIGSSRTIKSTSALTNYLNNQNHNKMRNGHNVEARFSSQSIKNLQEYNNDDDDDEESDIYVILDEN